MIIHLNRRNPSRSHVRRLSDLLLAGTPVVLPTETQYALACDATSKAAIASVRAIKGRQPSAPFSVFLPGISALEPWRIDYPEYAVLLAGQFWPGALTLILPTSNPIFKLLGGDGRSVGVRCTPEPIIASLLIATSRPIVATSANPSGVVMDARAENRWLTGLANGGELVWVKPDRYIRKTASTVIDCTGKVPRELRPGPISKAAWNAALRTSV
jgi:L-threonylcarbamoyladenylate synthase